MSEFSFPKVLWERESAGVSAMDSCYKLYTWVNHTVLMLLFQIFWKVSQISDYLTGKSPEPKSENMVITFSPLTKESKYRRHIRSMSDVQSSTPYRIPFRSRKGSTQTLMYDSDTRARRIRNHRYRQLESSDSSDYFESPKKIRSLGQNILKHTDSMRIL
ncbi:unnamed protein product [Spodoptera littoralis]|uniref:Uncharacterized protein n=1 Tax=Spodoptera littoralis TaxID=7109 RepID=A0A9P0N1X4_SPOLI|nr:unnamed protein product [Spodoptera littoralis]CAH1638601.1 unnamed protein product [Spodoptera littoralis]